MKKNGFTLIETLITLAIMATLTVMTARAIQQALNSKAKIQEQIDNITQVRDVAKLIERDVQLAYHASDLEKELAFLLAKTKASPVPSPNPNENPIPTNTPNVNADGSISTPNEDIPNTENDGLDPNASSPASSAQNQIKKFIQFENRIAPTTHFMGKEKEFHFVTSNTVRLSKDAPQSDIAEVGYYLDSCKIKADKTDDAGQCLFRRFSPVVDKDVTKGGKPSQIMEHVLEFKVKYYSKKKKDWVDEWRSDKTGDDNTKGFFPEAIQVDITMKLPKNIKIKKDRSISIQVMAPLHFPNNPSVKQANTN